MRARDWIDNDDHPFAGIAEKLKRSDQNIGNLHSEIVTFFQESKYPVLPDVNDKEWQQAVDYHRGLKIPKRFSILSGEIVHHLRSALDHVVWYFSSPEYRRDYENLIGFPIYRTLPTKRERPGYEGKIKGITNSAVRDMIEKFQPYHRGDNAISAPICIVHDMDRFDKHRELAIVASCANVTFPKNTDVGVIFKVIAHSQGGTLSRADLMAVQKAVNENAKVMPQVAFTQVGKRKGQFVVPTLVQLQYVIARVVDLFAKEA